ncbi:MAG: tRNA dihydrouridine synthase DusB [Bacteroidia bacterium]|nr:tRNA dihydrouridine synthase DusB [Bacteroidia bacterium]
MKIGTINTCQYPLFLAPMEDVSDELFRRQCKSYGADVVFTEFVSSEAMIRHVRKTMKKMVIHDEERPIGIQIYGTKPDSMAEAARIATEANPDLIDINFGCPVRKIAMKGGGAGLLQDIPKMISITSAVVNATHLPVTVKTRLGWDDHHKEIVKIAEMLQDVGILAITIHGRTREQMYRGTADWTLIGEVKNNPRMHIPIIGNGDIDSPEKARYAFDTYGVDGIMIGRVSVGRPSVFRDIRHYLDTGILLPPLTLVRQVDELRSLVSGSVELLGERIGILHVRRHMAHCFKGLPDFRELRIHMLRTENVQELNSIFDEIVRKYS